MKKVFGGVLAAGVVGLLAVGQPARAEEGDTTFKLFWKEGFRMETADKRFKAQLTGRVFNDWAFYSLDDELETWIEDVNGLDPGDGDVDDNVEFRAARLAVSAEIYDRILIKAEYDFADGDSAFKDVYLGVKDLPYVGEVKVGHFKEPFSIEELTSSRFITFMERGLPNIFAPSRNSGLGFQSTCMEERINYAFGVFREADDFGESTDEGWGLSARVTGLPWYEEEGARLVHLGLGVTHREPDEGTGVRFRQRPESHNQNRFVNTGTLDADQYTVVGPEVAVVYGPFSVQAEYMFNMVESDLDDDPDFDGFYVFGSWFATGEHRNYKPSSAAFDRVKPNRNFLDGDGMGAFEIAARYSNLDLNDQDVVGGEIDDVTAGVNWYLNPNVRVMLNYIHSWVDGLDTARALGAALGTASSSISSVGDADIVQARFQFDF